MQDLLSICFHYIRFGNAATNTKIQTMKYVAFMIIAFTPMFCFGQTNNPNYDAILADSLGADDYGMKFYTFVMLESGAQNDISDSLKSIYFRGHMSNIQNMAASGKLLVAGPFGNNSLDYRGIFILDVTDSTEVHQLLAQDPAIEHGLLQAKIAPWYGSAALKAYLPYSEKIWKASP